MEGLLPLVYKAIKKTRTRRQYECLSSVGRGASSLGGYTINMAEMYPQNHNNQTNQRFGYDDDHHIHHVHGYAAERSSSTIGHHRRHKSVGDSENGFQSPQMMMMRTGVVVVGSDSSPKQLMRSGSQRMFSCITGA